MDPAKVLETVCDLFLESEIVFEGACNDIKKRLKNGEYTWVARFFIYRLIFEVNESLIYNEIRKDIVGSAIFILISIDINGFENPFIIEQYINLMNRFFKYISEYRLNLRTNKEKYESIKAKLAELSMLIEE
jgi:hypothetical protein